MNIHLQPGRYVAAVSGGVDSMVLLVLLSRISNVEIIVAHFDHGAREDSGEDRKLVEQTAKAMGLRFVYAEGKLGVDVSEADARDARYAFLNKVKDEYKADAILTGHHQDDLIETAIINLARGTGRKGLSSLQSKGTLIRPLLQTPKEKILEYAQQHGIVWREDSTNASDGYLRNYIRHNVMWKLSQKDKSRLLGYIEKAAQLNLVIDELLLQKLHNQEEQALNRQWFVMLPYDVSCEVLAAWLRQHGLRDFDRRNIERLVVAAKVAYPGKTADINADFLLKVNKKTLNLTKRSLVKTE